jgi:hypothetical protein
MALIDGTAIRHKPQVPPLRFAPVGMTNILQCISETGHQVLGARSGLCGLDAWGWLPLDGFRSDDDSERACGAFFEAGAGGAMVLVLAVGVGELHGAGANDLKAVVEVGSGGEVLGAEAGAGIVHFDECDGVGGVVAYGGFDVGGAASGEGKAEDQDRGNAIDAHGTEGIR